MLHSLPILVFDAVFVYIQCPRTHGDKVQGADSPPLPPGAAKAGRNHLNK